MTHPPDLITAVITAVHDAGHPHDHLSPEAAQAAITAVRQWEPPTRRTNVSTKTTETADRLLTTEQTAELLGSTVQTVHSINASKRPLPRFRVGRESRYRLSEVLAWLEVNRVA